ncbi:hypothetical protein Tco_0169821 [Tanacetum coccineum]
MDQFIPHNSTQLLINPHLLQLLIRQHHSGLAVPVFKQGDDPIDAINKMMSFLSTVVTSCFLSTNNQLRNSSNPRQQATIHDGRVTVQPLQGRPNSYATGEGHMARQCPKPKRKRDATWFRDKVLLVEAQGIGKVLNEEELEFLADPDIAKAKAVRMANLSSYGLDLLSEVVQIVLWYLDFGCSKHMTEDRSQLTNFVHKFLGTVKFGNDQVAKIMGYSDYQIENVTISRVYYVEGLGHNLFSVGQFCDSDLEVAFRKHTCFVHNLEGGDLLSGS